MVMMNVDAGKWGISCLGEAMACLVFAQQTTRSSHLECREGPGSFRERRRNRGLGYITRLYEVGRVSRRPGCLKSEDGGEGEKGDCEDGWVY